VSRKRAKSQRRRERKGRGRAPRERPGAEAVPPPAVPPRLAPADLLAAAGLVVLVLLAYANALSVPFVYDDYGSIVENPSVHWRELSVENARAAWLRSTTRRVVANWSFGLDHRISGLDPSAYHATNIAIHVLASVAVYALLLHLLCRRARAPVGGEGALRLAAWIGAAVFAVHPLGTQAVTYVVQRMASLAALFCVASLLLYARGRARTGARRGALWLASGLAWGLAIGSKESAATFPAVIALYEWLFHRGADRRTALRLAGVVAVAAAASLLLMRFNYGDPFRDTFYHDFTLGERLLSQPRVLAYYVGLIAWPDPSRLSLMHDFAPSRGAFAPWTTLPALALLLGAVYVAVRVVDRRPLYVFALAWFGLALAVEQSVFPLRLAHEHRLYLPLVGVAIAVAGAARSGLARRRAPVLAVAVVVIGLLAFATHVRNRVWQDRASIWADVVEKSPSEGIAYANLAATHIEQERYDEALVWLERGRAAAPDYPGIARGIGVIHAVRGEYEEALALLQRAVALDPLDHAGIGQIGIVLVQMGRPQEALRYFEESTRIFEHPRNVNHHGKALAQLGRYREAIPLHRRALELAPDDGYAHVALGAALVAVGRPAEARPWLERALELEDPVGAHIELAGVAWQGGDPSGALAHLREAIALRPESLVAHNNLAWMLATVDDAALRDGAEALALIDVAESLIDEPDADLLDTRAAAQAAVGRFGEARETALRAVSLARAEGDAVLARDIEQRAELYAAGRAYVESIARRAER
jgi:tetratricopeptide (TPR) repeat protein